MQGLKKDYVVVHVTMLREERETLKRVAYVVGCRRKASAIIRIALRSYLLKNKKALEIHGIKPLYFKYSSIGCEIQPKGTLRRIEM